MEIQEAKKSPHRGLDPSKHEDGCPFKKSATCSVGVECEHGYDVCPSCDPCTCSELPK